MGGGISDLSSPNIDSISVPPMKFENGQLDIKPHVIDAFNRGVKEGVKLSTNEIEIVSDSLAQHKYARLSQASYDYFNSKGDPDAVSKGLKDPTYDYIEDLAGFEMDKDLSNIDNLVLHNQATGETVVSYRGSSTDFFGDNKNFYKDWTTNAEIGTGSTNTVRVRNAETQMEKVIAKYGKNNLSTVGHSQGGHVSYEMGVRFDVPSHSYNPAINGTQVVRKVEGEAEHIIYKTPLDFASAKAYDPRLTADVKLVKNIPGMDSVVQTHSLDQFTPAVEEVSEDILKVSRRTMVGSIAKGVGHAVNVGAYGYEVYQTVKDDSDETALKTVADLAKKTEQFTVDGEIIAASLAAAPETFGASLIFGAGAVFLNDLVGDKVEDEVVYVANKVSDEVIKDVDEIQNRVKRTGRTIAKAGKTVERAGKKVVKFFKGLGF